MTKKKKKPRKARCVRCGARIKFAPGGHGTDNGSPVCEKCRNPSGGYTC